MRDTREGWWTRDNALVVVLVAATALLLFLSWQLVRPFLGAIAWAVALAVVTDGLHRRIARRIKKPGLAAGLAVLLVAVVIVAPAVFVGHNIVRETVKSAQSVQAALASGGWREQIAQRPPLDRAVRVLERQIDLGGQLQALGNQVGTRVTRIIAGSAWGVIELLLTLFVLFYLFRDRHEVLATVRSLVPLSEGEADDVFRRVSDTIHATIFGTLVVAAVQGALGGLMFWWLGLPAPILWGTVMALLALVPVLGAFVVWVPAAIYLALNGQWIQALVLTFWGSVVIALIDNLLYPILVGKQLRLHTVPVFFAIVGGLMVFGAAGLILGPLILALTDAVLEIWRRRTAHGRTAEGAVAPEGSREPTPGRFPPGLIR